MPTKVLWQEMFKDEFEAAVAARPVCYFSFGLSEPHGLQNAMGLDGLKAYALVQRAAAAHGGVVAPPVWWHVHETPLGLAWLSQQNAPRPYLTCIPPEVFLHQLVYQLRAAEALLVGHGELPDPERRVEDRAHAHGRGEVQPVGEGIELVQRPAAQHPHAAGNVRDLGLPDEVDQRAEEPVAERAHGGHLAPRVHAGAEGDVQVPFPGERQQLTLADG